ncbi:MAG TPA: hypothetical protein VHM65_04145 [Candidatus Lustribacter sp.]|nr:hypothetical protein [Candidatus Lustribacter sp.]
MTQTVQGSSSLSGLAAAVTALRDEVAAATLPLALPEAKTAMIARDRLLAQLDDYIIPRMTSLDAPILAVVGGSTGAGKSTLVNSLVGSVVSLPGVLRPTTRAPVLVHHPDDARWFTGPRILPSLARVTGPAPQEAPQDPSAVRLVAIDTISPGLALLDAPDIDSVVLANRALATALLAAADLWVFVTTAARYADAVPWELLTEAGERGTSVAIVLDRVPPAALEEVRAHLGAMLRRQGLRSAPVFTILESRLDPDGLLPTTQTARLHGWLTDVADDAQARSQIVHATLSGALESLDGRTRDLSRASRSQLEATATLAAEVDAAYADALGRVRHGISDGSLLRGEVLARWQEYVGTGELVRQVESTVSRVRDRLTSLVTGDPAPTQGLGEALHSGAADLIVAHAQVAASTAARSWRSAAGGPALLAGHPELAQSSAGLPEAVARMVRDWQGEILDLVRGEGKSRRATARMMAYGVNGVGVVLILVTFAHTGGITGAEAGIAGGTAVLGQKLLEAIFGDQAVRELAARARRLLVAKVEALYAAEGQRYHDVVAALEVSGDQPRRLDEAERTLRSAR